jgi:hypothetical protein
MTLLCAVPVVHADDKALIGIFSGQGRPCWGKLYLTSKTIEWQTPYSSCKKTAYDVVEQNLESKHPTAAYRLRHQNPACKFPYISLQFDPEYPDYWRLIGYASKKAFEQRKEQGAEQEDQRLECSARKLE